jgi:hypothetical protein
MSSKAFPNYLEKASIGRAVQQRSPRTYRSGVENSSIAIVAMNEAFHAVHRSSEVRQWLRRRRFTH